MCRLQVQVFANETAQTANKRLFERIIEINDACEIPYSTLSKSLQFLYGSKIIINFNLYFK